MASSAEPNRRASSPSESVRASKRAVFGRITSAEGKRSPSSTAVAGRAAARARNSGGAAGRSRYAG